MAMILTAVFVTLGTVLVDRITKIIVRSTLKISGETVTLIPKVLQMRYVENDGAAWGMLDNARWIFMSVSAVAIIAIIWFLCRQYKRHPLLTVSLCVIMGGGIGNMIDRIFVVNEAGTNVVTDFLEFTFVNFPVFNMADTFITIGAVMLGVYVIFFEPKVEKREKLKKAEKSEEPAEENANDEFYPSTLFGERDVKTDDKTKEENEKRNDRE